MKSLIKMIPIVSLYLKYIRTRQQASFMQFLKFRLWGGDVYWRKEKGVQILNPRNIYVGVNCSVGRCGSYYQGAGGIFIGNYVRLANNVGLLSSNHDLLDHNKSHHKKIVIGDYSWIGMNAVITAGVTLGTRTIVGAGSVVTKSFPDGYCVIAGNPAKLIKKLDKDQFKEWHHEEEWYGFFTKEEFKKKKTRYLDL